MTERTTDIVPVASSSSDELRCKGFNKLGEPCRSPFVDRTTSYCRVHDPDKVAEVELMRIMGGKATSNEARIERRLMESSDLGGLVDVIRWSIGELVKSPMSPAIGNSISSLARALLAAREQALDEARQMKLLELLADRLGGVVDIEELMERAG